MKLRVILALVAMFLSVGCAATQMCKFKEKEYRDGLGVYLRERGEICLCEEDHWICIPVGGASQQ